VPQAVWLTILKVSSCFYLLCTLNTLKQERGSTCRTPALRGRWRALRGRERACWRRWPTRYRAAARLSRRPSGADSRSLHTRPARPGAPTEVPVMLPLSPVPLSSRTLCVCVCVCVSECVRACMSSDRCNGAHKVNTKREATEAAWATIAREAASQLI